MNKKTRYILPAVSALLFIILIILIKTVDVMKTGAGDTEIGLYHLNSAVHSFFGGVNTVWYRLTQITGYLSIAAGGIFAFCGLWQAVIRKSVLKIDKEFYALFCLYFVTAVLYAFFEKVIINYRPVIMAGETVPEASFPSSHTVLALILMGGIFLLIGKYIKQKVLLYVIKSLCAAIAVITVIGRLAAGVHWFTDILGGVILSVCLLSLFRAVIAGFESEKETKSI